MFSKFDFRLLNDPDFKEDAVREELISPLLSKLGYSAGGPNKIIRSKSLEHPFVHIGTKKHNVKIIPDYLLVIDDKHKWILDAKSPKENILKGKHPEQAFSYAIHPDVRAFRYCLCNGKQLVVFEVNRKDPVLIANLDNFDQCYEQINNLLSPVAFTKPHLLKFKPDFGLYAWKIGLSIFEKLHFVPMGVPLVAKLEDDLFMIALDIQYGDDWYAVSFDFDKKRYKQLLLALPEEKASMVVQALKQQPFKIHFEHDIPVVNIEATLGGKVFSNENEDYCPLIAIKIQKY